MKLEKESKIMRNIKSIMGYYEYNILTKMVW